MGFSNDASGMTRHIRFGYARLLVHLSGSGVAARRLKRQELKYDRSISRREDFADLLARNDRSRVVKRIFVMGCGRSGTWLLYSLLSMVKHTYALFEEVDVGRFARIKSAKPNHILKRDSKSFRTADRIPKSIGIVWIVRHPFDVMTSHNPGKANRSFHINPDRWNGEMDALRRFIEHPRPNGIVVKYEDLVSEPDLTLSRVAAIFGLEISGSACKSITHTHIPADVRDTMNGLRQISTNSVGRWRSDPDLVARVHNVVGPMRERLEWVSERFGYEVTPPDFKFV